MKQFILGLAIGAFGLFAIHSCSERTGNTSEESKEFVAPKGLISMEEGLKREKAFVKNEYAWINAMRKEKGLDGEDNREFWWSIEEIENYLGHAKKIATENGKEINGVRVYLGEKEEKTDIFLITTVKVEKETAMIDNPLKKQIAVQTGTDQNYGDAGLLNIASSGKPPRTLDGN